MASMLSRTTVEHMLLPRFCELCSDGKLFQVRKVRVFSTLNHLKMNLYVAIQMSS